MKKEFKDLAIDEKKEYLFLEALTIDLPYTIALIPFIILLLITTNKYVGFGCLWMLFCIGISFYIDYKKLKDIYGLN